MSNLILVPVGFCFNRSSMRINSAPDLIIFFFAFFEHENAAIVTGCVKFPEDKTLPGTKIVSLSSANTCSNEKEKEFMEKIKKETNDKFIPVFSPNCIDYQNIQEARKDLKKKIEIAKKRDLRVIFINFSK